MLQTISLNHGYRWGHLDTLHLNRTGLIRVVGWTHETSVMPEAVLRINGAARQILNVYRTYRPDVAKFLNSNHDFHGIVYEFLSFPFDWQGKCIVAVEIDQAQVANVSVEYCPVNPHYSSLFSDEVVQHRDQIYAYGPPSLAMSGVVQASLKPVRGPALDFGCGIGLVVRELRSLGTEAYGLEIERPAISDGLLPEVRDFIKLYDGSLPIPYADKQFDSVTCFEVLEHVGNYEAALQEIARVTRRQFLMSVPDISAIPDCYPSGVIPWHLLEATHVNFFCQKSLEQLLHKYFKKVDISRIGVVHVNDSFFFTSLMALCSKE